MPDSQAPSAAPPGQAAFSGLSIKAADVDAIRSRELKQRGVDLLPYAGVYGRSVLIPASQAYGTAPGASLAQDESYWQPVRRHGNISLAPRPGVEGRTQAQSACPELARLLPQDVDDVRDDPVRTRVDDDQIIAGEVATLVVVDRRKAR